MNEKVLKTLEYHKILGQLTEYAFSDEAKSLCRSLRPVSDRAVIERLQQETSDALGRILRKLRLGWGGTCSEALTPLAARAWMICISAPFPGNGN